MMVIECFVILILIAAMAVVFLRRERWEYALAILPLLVVPGVHLLAPYLVAWTEVYTRLDRQGVLVVADAAALVVSCLLIGALSVHIKSRRTRRALIIVCGIFLILLSFILISNILIV